MHLYSLCQTWLNLKTHTVSETENRGKGGGRDGMTAPASGCAIPYQCARVPRDSTARVGGRIWTAQFASRQMICHSHFRGCRVGFMASSSVCQAVFVTLGAGLVFLETLICPESNAERMPTGECGTGGLHLRTAGCCTDRWVDEEQTQRMGSSRSDDIPEGTVA